MQMQIFDLVLFVTAFTPNFVFTVMEGLEAYFIFFFFFFRHSCWCIVQYYLLVLMFNRCPVTVDMKIKLITRQTVQKYKAVRSYPCIITIEGEHNRNIECVLSVKQLRVLSATMQDFFQLFSIRKVETLIREQQIEMGDIMLSVKGMN